MIDHKKICVLGAGVSGLSTAYLLLEKGYQVNIISRDDPDKNSSKPHFSSLFPAASIIPHGIHTEKLIELFRVSQRYFENLQDEGFPGINITQHYELFSYSKKMPEYASEMNQLEVLDEFRNKFYPDHPKYKAISGWKFNTFLADWPIYFPHLISTVLEKVSGFEIRYIDGNDLPHLPFDVIINCTEIGSIDLFDDDSPGLIHRGHLINVPAAPPVLNKKGQVVSYNFSPGQQVYQSETGNHQDVYCYSRHNDIVLGGSRQKGTIDKNGTWMGETNRGPIATIDGLEVPLKILELHKDILRHSFDYDLPHITKMRSKLGYRFTRAENNGLRIEIEEIEDKLVIHNYGHGGAGVTLSWGCAQRVVDLLHSANI